MQVTYVQRNIEERSCNHCCCWKGINITYCVCVCMCVCVCVCVALAVQQAIHMCHIMFCGLTHSTIFFPHYLINGTIFGKKNVIDYKMCVLMFSTTFVRNISLSKMKCARCDQKVQWSSCSLPLFLSDIMKRNLYWQFFITLRRLMSYIYIYIYIYGAPILDVSRSHTTTQHSR